MNLRPPEKAEGKCPECKKETLYERELNHVAYIECVCGYTCSIMEYSINIKTNNDEKL